jgi:hypothetical protein
MLGELHDIKAEMGVASGMLLCRGAHGVESALGFDRLWREQGITKSIQELDSYAELARRSKDSNFEGAFSTTDIRILAALPYISGGFPVTFIDAREDPSCYRTASQHWTVR